VGDENVVRSFEDLEVYQRAYRLALELHKVSVHFPKIEQFALADQIRRASKSVCANIAEGFARQRGSSADFHRFLVMALGSSDEMKVWRACFTVCETSGNETLFSDFRFPTSDFRAPLAEGERVTAYLLYYGSAT
jgi:four helix bundle protein